MSIRFLQAALPPSRSRTGKTAAVPYPRRCTVRPSPACRFAWPSGGTEEFLGRWSARSNSWRTEAKGVLTDPPYVFGAADRPDGNHKDRTSRCRHEGSALVTRSTIVSNRRSQVGNSGVRALILVSIYGLDKQAPHGQGSASKQYPEDSRVAPQVQDTG